MNDRLRDLMSGRSRGLAPSAARAGLRLAAAGYGVAVGHRNRRFDRGIGVFHAGVPVISVGNLTAGGTGKTPVVALIANYFRRWGVNVALLSRGYHAIKRNEPSASAVGSEICDPPAHAGGSGDKLRQPHNDEALVLEHLCPGVPHVQQANRVAGAAEAVSRFGSEVLILDDGFQHRRLARDLDIVLIDATNPFGYGHLLPRGLLREPIENLRRADLILLTRADSVSHETLLTIRRTIARVAPCVPIIDVAFPASRLVNSAGESSPLESLEDVPTLAFCGIGNPAGFAATLKAANVHPAEVVSFPDHHHYSNDDLARLARRADAFGVATTVTTLKDLVKIRAKSLPQPSGAPVWAVETTCEVVANDMALFGRLDEVVRRVAVPKAA